MTLFPEGYTLFNRGISPAQIQQRLLGDCYFIAAVSSLADHPERIERLFTSHNLSHKGIYGVKLFIAGIWETVIIDDFLPFDPENKMRLAFSSCRDGSLWLSFLLKAWAKVFGGYLNISTGTTYEALVALTGAPTGHYEIIDCSASEHWSRLREATSLKFPICASSKKFDRINEHGIDIETGLTSTHAYSIIDSYDVEIANKKEKVLKLRNPWGQDRFRGEWAKGSRKWSPSLEAAMGVDWTSRGIFFMTLAEFIDNFHSYNIAMVIDTNSTTCAKLSTPSDTPTALRVNITTPGQYTLSIHQLPSRLYRHPYSSLF